MKKPPENQQQQQQPNSPEVPTGKTSLRQPLDLISSLITVTHTTKVFPAKWQTIRHKLDQLNSGLTTILNCNPDETTRFSDLIPAIMSPLLECQDHARSCTELSYSGKLLMQSDLDVLSAKFDILLRRIAGIYTAGIIPHSSAIVVSRPAPNASRDDMKFFVKDLFTRLQIGNLEMKNQALFTLNQILTEDDKYIRIVAGIIDFNLLVKFLEFEGTGIQEESAGVVSAILSNDCYKNGLVTAGVIGPLVKLIETGSDLGKERAAVILQKLTANSDNVWSVSAHGGVTALLSLCRTGTTEAVRGGSGALKNLASVVEIKKFMVEDGVISIMVNLLKSGDEILRIQAAEVLQILGSGDESIKQMEVKEGAIQSLVSILDCGSNSGEIALKVIIESFSSSTIHQNLLISSGFLDKVLVLLRSSDGAVLELAVKAVCIFCRISDDMKRFLGDSGFLPELVKLLDAKSAMVREIAAEAVSNLVAIPKNRRRFVDDDNNVTRVLELLDPGTERSGRKFLLSALMTITSSNSGRRKIAASGSLQHLEKLAETEVGDAKRIVRKLSGIPSIWFAFLGLDLQLQEMVLFSAELLPASKLNREVINSS